MLQGDRKSLYQKRILEIAKDTSLLKELPNPVYESIKNYEKNPTDENWAIFESRVSFYAKEAKTNDPHTNLLVSAIYYNILYTLSDAEEVEKIMQLLLEKKCCFAGKSQLLRIP